MNTLVFIVLLRGQFLFSIEQFLYSNQLKALAEAMSTQKVSQQLFMKIKERLDYHRLPSTFPVEAAPLLNKLLRIIDSRSAPQGFAEPEQFCGDSVSAALKHETGRLVRQNNELHMNLIVAKEQIQSLEHTLFKIQANRHSNEKELQRIQSFKSKREQELVTEVQQIRYKYNELMDFLHEDPYAEKEYIKRLMKHKQIEDSGIQAQESKQVAIFKPIDSNYRVRELQIKVKNRQAQILRLQKVVEYDGVNLNKIIKNFNEDLVKKQLKYADHKINYLQESFDKIKKQNASMRNKNGLKQALRSQVEKCHKVISTLKKENNQLKRNHIQQNFDLEKKTSENDRKIGKAKLQKSDSEKQKEKLQRQVSDLTKKIQYLEKELKEIRKSNQSSAELIGQKETQNMNLMKKNEEIKVFYQYEIEALSKRKSEQEAELEETRLKARELLSQYQLKSNENELKTESILNLEKIVNELIRKNSVLADHTTGTLEESLKQSAELQLKNRLNAQERQLALAQKERVQIETNIRALQNRFEQVIGENQRFRYENSKLRGELLVQTESVLKLNNEIDSFKHLLKREEAQKNRALNISEETNRTKNTKISELEDENDRLKQQEKALKLRLKDLQIKISQEEGVWEVTRIRLEDKETKIKQLQKLLGQTVDQIKGLSNQINELEHQNHQLTKEKHRLGKKYEELRKDEEQFKTTSFKNYQTAINDNLAQISDLKKELMRLSQSYQGLQGRYEEVSNMASVLQREKQLIQFDKISLIQEVEILNTRVMEMQEIERTLVLENESLRSLGRSL